MAANPALMFGAVCCGIFGISFFCGFYFGTVQSDIEHNKKIDDLIARVINETCTPTSIHKTAEETCDILNQTTTSSDCAQKHSCGVCYDHLQFVFPSCTSRENTVGSSGPCNSNDDCCLNTEYVILYLLRIHRHTYTQKQMF